MNVGILVEESGSLNVTCSFKGACYSNSVAASFDGTTFYIYSRIGTSNYQGNIVTVDAITGKFENATDVKLNISKFHFHNFNSKKKKIIFFHLENHKLQRPFSCL